MSGTSSVGGPSEPQPFRPGKGEEAKHGAGMLKGIDNVKGMIEQTFLNPKTLSNDGPKVASDKKHIASNKPPDPAATEKEKSATKSHFLG